MISNRRKNDPRKKVIGFFIIPFYLLYCEVLFKLLTVANCPPIAWLPTVFFPIIIGIVISVFTGFSKNPKVNRIARGIIMCILGILFIVNIFIYRQFKVFYDTATVVNGAGGVATSYLDHVFGLIFSLSGILAIVLYLAPPILYFVFGHKIDSGEKENLMTVLQLGIVFAVIGIINLPIVHLNEVLKNAYSLSYNFQSAVTDFGLLTGIRLDLQRNALRSLGFNSTTIVVPPDMEIAFEDSIRREGAVVDDRLAEEAANIVYGKSVMDIDFAALAAKTSDATFASLDNYVASLTPSSKNEYTGIFKGKNLILITAEAFSDKLVSPELTPTLYRLMTKGINFTDYTQQASAGTIGGEYQHIFGLFPSDGGGSFLAMSKNTNWFTMGAQLTALGYYGKPFHNGDYTYYDRNITHNSIGYSDEYMAYGNGMENLMENAWPRSDIEMFEQTMPMYLDKQPFSVYYMTVSGHSLYNLSGNAISAKNWEYVKDLDYSETVRCYIAANLELEFALQSMVKTLEEKGIADDTVIVITTDHFPYGLDIDGGLGNLPYLAELYGYAPTTYLERDENGLIIWCGELEDWETITVDTPVSSIDILPTLCNLFDLDWDSRLLPGRDVFSDAEPLVFNFVFDWKTDKGTYIASRGEFTPNEGVTVDPNYVARINSIVRAKMDYCWDVMDKDYFGHVLKDSGYKLNSKKSEEAGGE